MSRRVSIEVYNKHCAYLRGRGTYDAIAAVTGGKPVRSSRAKAWVVSERTALQRVLPWLEREGYDVTITGQVTP